MPRLKTAEVMHGDIPIFVLKVLPFRILEDLPSNHTHGRTRRVLLEVPFLEVRRILRNIAGDQPWPTVAYQILLTYLA